MASRGKKKGKSRKKKIKLGSLVPALLIGGGLLFTSLSLFLLPDRPSKPVASRSVFLDNDLSQEAMKVQWDRLFAVAREQGYAVVIAHPHREPLTFLKKHLRDLIHSAQLVRVAEIVR